MYLCICMYVTYHNIAIILRVYTCTYSCKHMYICIYTCVIKHANKRVHFMIQRYAQFDTISNSSVVLNCLHARSHYELCAHMKTAFSCTVVLSREGAGRSGTNHPCQMLPIAFIVSFHNLRACSCVSTVLTEYSRSYPMGHLIGYAKRFAMAPLVRSPEVNSPEFRSKLIF